MAGNENIAKRFDDGTEITKDDLNDLATNKKNAYDLFENNNDHIQNALNIRGQIQEASDLLSETEQKKFLSRLERIERKRDKEALQILHEEIKETIEETQRLMREYFSKLDVNKELFGLNPSKKIDTLQEYKDEFLTQEIEKKQKYLEALPDEIKSLQELRNKLIKYVGNSRVHLDEFGKLRRHEKREDYLPRLEENMRNFNDLMKRLEKSDEYNSRDINMMTVRFKESSLADQEKLLKEWGMEKSARGKETAESLTELKSDFNKFSRERQSRYGRDFDQAKTRKEKTEIITKMRAELKNKYMEKVDKTPYFSSAEKNFALASVSRSDFDIKFIEECVKNFDKCEKQVEKLAEIYEKAPEEIQKQYNFWESDYNKKKEIAAEVKEHMRIMKELEKKIKQLAEQGIIAKKTMGENGDYILRWRRETAKLSLDEKKKSLSDSSLQVPFRKHVLEQFKSMPEEYKKRFEKQFMKGNLRERLKILVEATREINETHTLQEKFMKKVKDFEKRKLIAHKTAAAYKEWIKKLPLKKLRDYYENSELDDPLRKKTLEAFQSLDDKTQKNNSRFYELDLDGRMALLRKLNPKTVDRIIEEANNEKEAKEKVVDFEQTVQIHTLRKAAEKFEEEGNIDSEIEIHKQILEINSKDKKSRERLAELEMEQNPLTQMLIYGSIKDNPAMRRKLEGLRIVEVFEYMLEQSQRHEGAKRLRDRSSRFEDKRIKDLNEALYDHTRGEKILDVEGEAANVEILDIDRVRDGNDQNIIEHYVDLFRNKRPDVNNEETSLGEHEYRGFMVKRRDGQELDLNRIREEKDKFIKEFAGEISRANSGRQTKIKKEDMEEATKKYSRLKNLNLD
ncbi:hypothetical protein HZA39_03315 [Candidatus Peregrinibacteria bacterium]|nr:hypothetical protein [Candidatus Peregrinibacteria bacterium]